MASRSAGAVSLCWFLFILLLLYLLFVGMVNAGTDDTEGALDDVRALIEFKKWITSSSYPVPLLKDWVWDDAANACNWTGIRCSNKDHPYPGRILEISLENASLRGSLSPHISNLSFLQVLDISGNTFSGKIPSSLGRLGKLQVLNLCVNEFEGGIPDQLGNLSSLQSLYLCSNSLIGQIPGSFRRLQHLQQLDVFQNQLGGRIPPWLGALQKLERLRLGENIFHGTIPAELGNLSSSLTLIGFRHNYLTGFIPCTLGRLYRLAEFHLPMNNLNGSIPQCLSNLTALIALDFSNNNLQGHLPTWIGSSLKKLQFVGLFGNGFTGNIPESWRNLTQLQVLELGYNSMSGTPPSWLGTLCIQLRSINIGDNYFISGVSRPSQPIPILRALSNCSLLIYLRLYGNHLTGTLPPDFGSSLPNLEDLSLQNNFISGNIPPSVGNFSSLVRLYLADNVFSGKIPPQIANLKSVQSIQFQENKLQGNIPIEMSLLNKSLGYLDLSENRLSGSIPANLGNLVNLRKLRLKRNLLSGEIPAEIGNCPVLEDLVLSSNNLSGAIPPKVAGLRSIVFDFDLSWNGLRGEVPPEIAKLQMAQFINLSSNQLSGNIASYMDSWWDARVINLTFNKFSGNLSKSIGNQVTQLESIDLSHNNFTGPVPASLLNHSNLHFLNFSYNNFDGEVPCLASSSKKLRLTSRSFLGNPSLCGRCFDLKACLISLQQHSFHFTKSSILKIVLGVQGGLLLLVVAGILFIFRITKTSEGETTGIGENFLGENFLKISVKEIRRATENFSASNLIGEGSHGKVYRGVLSSGMVVAVKCLSPTDQRGGTVKSFRKECRALGKVRHRNILKIITVIWDDELKALVMPFLGNGNLHCLLHSRKDGRLTALNLPIRVKILTELARALGYLHHGCGFQVIHCDIKPENVLLDDDTSVKLSDFGISCLDKDFDGPTTFSSSLTPEGSVGYIAPEYGIGAKVSVKGDVYSFGVVTLEVITRLKPTHDLFSGDLTLPLWISMALEGKTGEERREALKNIISTADERGGGIEMNKDEEMSVVERILMLGLRCTRQNASKRPNMKEVESFLQSVSTGSFQNPMTLPGNLENVIKIVESQPPLYHKKVKVEGSSFSSD